MGEKETKTDGKTKITFWAAPNPTQLKYWEEMAVEFEKENPGITVKQVPVEEDAYNTKVITLARTGALPEVIEVSHDYAKVMDKEQLLDRKAIGEAIKCFAFSEFAMQFVNCDV